MDTVEEIELTQMVLEICLIENESIRSQALTAASNLYGHAFLKAYRIVSGEEDRPDPEEEEALSYKQNFEAFCKRFFPHFCTAEFSSMHREFFEEFDGSHGKRDIRDANAAPRGNAKTTIRTVIKTIYDICFGLEDFIVVMSANFRPLALDKVRGIRDELEMNQDLNLIYGFNHSLMTKDWNQSDFIARNRWGHETRIIAGSPKSQVRGFLWHGMRPTKISLDDIEDPKHVHNDMQRDKMMEWFTSDIAKLGTLNPGAKRLNIDFVGTILHEDSLLANTLVNPGYRSKKYQAVLEFAHNTHLWQQWRDIFIELGNENRIDDARAFFDNHSVEMLEGSEVLWPEGETYYDLMVQRIVEGEASFWQEKQNHPQLSGDYPFKMDQAAYFTIMPDRIVRSDKSEVFFQDITSFCAFFDPTPGDSISNNPDFAACVVAMSDYHGYIYIVDAYIEQFDNSSTQVSKVAALIADWSVSRIGLEANNFQSLLTKNLKNEIAIQKNEYPNWDVEVHQIRQHANKERRIYSLEPLIDNKWLQFSDNLPEAYMRQMLTWLPVKNSGKDDGPDATEGVIRVIRQLRDTRSSF